MSLAFYNEIEPYAAEWLRNLIRAGLIAPGVVDERSITELEPGELAGYTQCHFFAGIGVWSYALRTAGWPDARPVWTGSCPCQPFSAAGAGAEFDDARHLWPAWFRLVRECRPVAVFGEQVASRDALAWLDHVCHDLEGAGYAVGAVDSCAAGYGAPHIRQRLYWVADADGTGSSIQRQRELPQDGDAQYRDDSDRCGEPEHFEFVPAADGQSLAMVDADNAGSQGREQRGNGTGELPSGQTGVAGSTNGFWSAAEWIPCRDGKARPTEPGTFPLAHGATARVGRLRAYGNAICAPQAAEFVRAYLGLEA